MRRSIINFLWPHTRHAVFAAACVASVALAKPAPGQVSPEEHRRHHPERFGNEAGDPDARGDGHDGSHGNAPGPPGDDFGRSGDMSGGGMMGGGMMERMGAPPPREMYPTLMGLPDLSPEQRDEVEREAHQRMMRGTALLSEGLDALPAAAERDDFEAMQAATTQMQEGLAQFESGLAAQRALRDGEAPREVALHWFKREMNLLPPAPEDVGFRFWGMGLFHTAVMALLVAFAAAMLWMYFFKMRRAAALLRDLTGGAAGTGTPAAASSVAASSVASAAASGLKGPASPEKPQKWSGNLRVSRIFQETPNVKTFRLMNPAGGALPFRFLPGQFLTVTVSPDGKPVKRSYTIASSPTQQDYAEITVKHEDGGVVSGYLDDRVESGDLLEVSGPAGAFVFTGRQCDCILLIGAGVGVTPLMSVLRYLTDRSWPGDVFLLYSCRTPDDIIFKEELDYLQRRHPNLKVVVTVSRPEGTSWEGPKGRISKELITQSVPDLESRYVHVCGPVPMMEAVKRMLVELGVPRERVKVEAFGPALGKPEPVPRTVERGPDERAARANLPTVRFEVSDKSTPLPPDEPILDVADEIGVEIDNSCRVGTCGLCRVKLLSGEVTQEVTDGLEPGDEEAGIVLACQAKSTGNVTVEA
ncbi:FAD-binding oxidoreductase [Alienimonas sp. DA493]|uniref:FAD-binding oxidoreductase n=1 Tax=Alienimonas sp. DA493 TaxID=3373605 RepID=UPI003753F7B5